MSLQRPDRMAQAEADDLHVLRESMHALGAAISSLEQPASPQMAAGVAATVLARSRVGQEFGYLSAAETSQLLGSQQPGGAYANDQRKAGRILGVPVRNTYEYPAFQFDASGRIRPATPAVLAAAEEFGIDADTVTQWFCLPSAGLQDRRPVDLIDDVQVILEDFRGRFGVQW